MKYKLMRDSVNDWFATETQNDMTIIGKTIDGKYAVDVNVVLHRNKSVCEVYQQLQSRNVLLFSFNTATLGWTACDYVVDNLTKYYTEHIKVVKEYM